MVFLYLTNSLLADKLKKAFAALSPKAFLYIMQNGITNCTYSDPIRYDGVAPTLPTHAFYFRTMNCTNASSSQPITISNMSIGYNPTTTISSSTSITVYGSLSAGEIMISLMLFLLIWIKLVELIAKGLSNIKTKKKFIAYSGGEVEIRDDN